VPNGFSGSFPLLSNPAKTCPGYISEDGGIWDYQTPVPIGSVAKPKMSSCPGGNLTQLGKSYVAIPEVDANNNSALGYTSLPTGPLTFSTANTDDVSMNATENAALAARKDKILIYAIGLHGNGGIDDSFLQRVANVPAAATYDSNQPVGKYYAAPNASQLNAAFQAIASDIPRISQ